MTGRGARGLVECVARVASSLFALAFVVPAVFVLLPLPGLGGEAMASAGGGDGVLASLPAFALALALSVVVRAVASGSASDAVLAAFSMPCLFAGAWGAFAVARDSPAVVAWAGLASFVAGVLLGVVVLADAVLERIAAGRASQDAR
ncbi:hypothetical protein [Halorubellus salinus]|uniref:hypothetical protein n=1 Tax=Halorubellus salinus TaxID=755309 RepID=UPI001D07B73B|nr:hypothetical protein [Halorubellus salinus]